MEYSALRLSRPLRIQEIVTVHYFEYASSYSFPEKVMTSGNFSMWTRAPFL